MADHLLSDVSDPRSRARLLASRAKESGAWLNVLPISSLGLRMDDNTIRVAIGLRLGVQLCRLYIHVTIVVLRWIAWPHMVSTVAGVKAVSIAMLP